MYLNVLYIYLISLFDKDSLRCRRILAAGNEKEEGRGEGNADEDLLIIFLVALGYR